MTDSHEYDDLSDEEVDRLAEELGKNPDVRQAVAEQALLSLLETELSPSVYDIDPKQRERLFRLIEDEDE